MNNNELFNAWLNLTKYHDRLLKAMDYKLQEQFQLGIKEFYLMYYSAGYQVYVYDLLGYGHYERPLGVDYFGWGTRSNIGSAAR